MQGETVKKRKLQCLRFSKCFNLHCHTNKYYK